MRFWQRRTSQFTVVLGAALSIATAPAPALADDNPLGMSYVRTRDLHLIYFDALRYLEPHAIRTYTNSLAWQRKTFDWVPSQPTTIMLKDLEDFGNASAMVAPRDLIIYDIAPLSHAFETFPTSERLYSLMNHEMVHIAVGDGATDEERRWRRRFLGKVAPLAADPETLLYSYLTVPRFTAPRWYNEGGAVFLETWMDGGIGRAQGGYDEMVFRAMVRDNAYFFDPLGLVSRGTRIDFQHGANHYLYGTRFFTWLAYTYSPTKVVAWLKRDPGSRRDYADQFEAVFGLPLTTAWSHWVDFEHEFQRRNLERVREHPITPARRLVARPVGSTSKAFYDERTATLYAAFRYPGVVEHVAALDTLTGKVRKLADIKRAILYRVTSLAYDAAGATVFYTNNNTALRDLMAIDLRSGRARTLLQGARIGEIAFNSSDRSLLGVRHRNGVATLVRIPYPYDRVEDVYTFSYEYVPYDLDISPDGRLLSASMSEPSSDQYLRVWQIDKLRGGDAHPLSEFRFGQSVPESFAFSKDGRYLYGSSYYTGVSNIYRYEVGSGAIEAVTNAESGFFRPVPLEDGRLIVFSYAAGGFVPGIIDPAPVKDLSAITFLGAEVAKKYPELRDWQVPPASTVDEQALITGRGSYRPLRELEVKNGYPVLQGYKKAAGLGYHLNIADPVSFANIGLTAAYTPQARLEPGERGHVELDYRYLGWHANLAWNPSDFYDLFGPTIRSRKGYALRAGYDRALIYDDPRRLDFSVEAAHYAGIDALPGYQNVATSVSHFSALQAGLRYTHVRRSIGAVDDEQGIAWDALGAANVVNGVVVPQLHGKLDLGIALPLPHASLWLRGAAGAASGAASDPFANFYFGGFGNNYVDRGAVQRYRDFDALPGFTINEISARRFGREMLELNLPPIVFESMGRPGFYIHWLRPALFASGLWVGGGAPGPPANYGSAGAQLDLHVSVLYWYDMTLSAGYAVGYRGSRRGADEWMVSLKIM
jgi:hypothetical protein